MAVNDLLARLRVFQARAFRPIILAPVENVVEARRFLHASEARRTNLIRGHEGRRREKKYVGPIYALLPPIMITSARFSRNDGRNGRAAAIIVVSRSDIFPASGYVSSDAVPAAMIAKNSMIA